MDTCSWCGQPIWGDRYVTNNMVSGIYCSDRCAKEAAIDDSPFKCSECGKKYLMCDGYHGSWCSEFCYNRTQERENRSNVYIPPAPATPANNGATANPTKDDPVSAAPEFSDTTVSLSGCSYTWQSCWGNCTLKIARIQNESDHGTGPLKLRFWLAPVAPKEYIELVMLLGSDYLMAESEIKGGHGLSKGYGYSDIEVSVPLTGDPPTGEYQAVLSVSEKRVDGDWNSVGMAIFAKPQKWTFINRNGPQNAAPKGSDTSVTIRGASYSYNGRMCTLKANHVQNDAAHGTAPLNMSLFFSKVGGYWGGTLDGYQVATISIGNGKGLSKGCEFRNVDAFSSISGKIPAGEYTPVITVSEKCEDGNWYIVGWANFPNSEKWGTFSKKGSGHQLEAFIRGVLE